MRRWRLATECLKGGCSRKCVSGARGRSACPGRGDDPCVRAPDPARALQALLRPLPGPTVLLSQPGRQRACGAAAGPGAGPAGGTDRLRGPLPARGQVRGVIPLGQATKVVPCDAPSGKYGFSVVPGVGKPIYLAAGALLVTQRWMVTLQSIAEGARPPPMSKRPAHERSISTSSVGSSSVRAAQARPPPAPGPARRTRSGRPPPLWAFTFTGGASELGRQRRRVPHKQCQRARARHPAPCAAAARPAAPRGCIRRSGL